MFYIDLVSSNLIASHLKALGNSDLRVSIASSLLTRVTPRRLNDGIMQGDIRFADMRAVTERGDHGYEPWWR